MGYGAMQLAGPHVFGPPADRVAAVAVLREAVEVGITHIDTSDFYGPHVTNQIIKEALHPYPDSLPIVTKGRASRDAQGGWAQALAPEQLRQAVHDNLRNLGLDTLDVVNLRVGGLDSPTPGSIAEPFTVLAQLRQEGLIQHLGLSTVSAEQVAEAQSIAPTVCVQNFYNPRPSGGTTTSSTPSPAKHNRIRALFPARRVLALAVRRTQNSRQASGRLTDGSRTGVAAGAHHRTSCSSPAPHQWPTLRENVAGAALTLSQDDLAELDRIKDRPGLE